MGSSTQLPQTGPDQQTDPLASVSPALVKTIATPIAAQPYISTAQTLQYPCWYMRGRTIFGARKGIATLSPGLLIMVDSPSNQPVYQYSLTPDIQVSAMFGRARITYLSGQKTSILDNQYMFFFYNPKLAVLSWFFRFIGSSKAKSFILSCKQAAGVKL